MKILQAYYAKGAKYVEAGTVYRFTKSVNLWQKNGRWCNYWGDPVNIYDYLEKEKPVEPKRNKTRRKTL